MYQNVIYICISWYNKICKFPVKKSWFQQNSRCVSRNSYIFWIFFGLGIIVPSFIIVGYVWQILGRGHYCLKLFQRLTERNRKLIKCLQHFYLRKNVSVQLKLWFPSLVCIYKHLFNEKKQNERNQN